MRKQQVDMVQGPDGVWYVPADIRNVSYTPDGVMGNYRVKVMSWLVSGFSVACVIAALTEHHWVASVGALIVIAYAYWDATHA